MVTCFALQKFYADLVTEDGTVCIVYLVWNEVFGLSVREARAYLASSLAWLAERYRQDGRLRAIILRNGQVGADHEALEMLAGVMSALQETAPEVADAMNARLQGTLSDGLWADRESYYIQNWAWFGTALHRRALAPFERLK